MARTVRAATKRATTSTTSPPPGSSRSLPAGRILRPCPPRPWATSAAPRRPRARNGAGAGIMASRTAQEWEPVFAAADGCVTIVTDLEHAVLDPHFVRRGLFAHQLVSAKGTVMPALPVPVDRGFRQAPRAVAMLRPGEHDGMI